MANIYKFKVKLCEFEDIMWREIELSSISPVAKLGYAILAAFDFSASHLFCITAQNKRFEIFCDDDYEEVDSEAAIEIFITKLSALKPAIGDVWSMEYDYGASWRFEIELLSITEMKRGNGKHYPYVTDGKGKSLPENISPQELSDMINSTEHNLIPQIKDYDSDIGYNWDYRAFDLDTCNALLKGKILTLQYNYEEYE